MNPCVSSVVSVRRTALVGSLGTRTGTPWRRASPSVSPTRASGGSVKHAVRNQPIPRAALPSGQIVPDDPKIIDGDVRKLWAAGAFPYRLDIGRRRLQPLIDANVATTIELDAGLLKPDPGSVRNAARRY